MTDYSVSEKLRELSLIQARSELTEHYAYSKLAKHEKNSELKKIFESLSNTEYNHYLFWSKFCPDEKINPDKFTIFKGYFLRKVFGSSFAIKYFEKKEDSAVKNYASYLNLIPRKFQSEFNKIIEDEKSHELDFAKQVQSEHLKYISFIVLGLADALVEIAGIHAGSLGIYNSTELTGLAGIVAGAAASVAMASAAFAQAKQGFEGSPILAAAYTGISYFISALILALPYFFTKNMDVAISVSLIFGILVIAFVSYYNSVMSQTNFKKDFLELASIMLGATVALYFVGSILRSIFGLTI